MVILSVLLSVVWWPRMSRLAYSDAFSVRPPGRPVAPPHILDMSNKLKPTGPVATIVRLSDDRILTAAEVREQLRASASTWKRWGRAGIWPPHVRVGTRNLFPQSKLDAWLSDRIVYPTSVPVANSPRAAAVSADRWGN